MRTIVVLFSFLAASMAHAASTINTANAYSYGANIGWMNWRHNQPNAGDGVIIGEYICSGYIYGANVGWINVGNGAPANNIQYQNNSATDFGLNYSVLPSQPAYAVLRGYAYGANIGWINFEDTGNPRIRFSDGALEGYAYSANCGWINLGDPSFHYLVTDTVAPGIDTDADGMPDAFEFQKFSGLSHTGSADSDGDGMTDLQEYLEGTDPNSANDRFRITGISTNPGGTNTLLTWTSVAGRLYKIDTTTDFAPPPISWTDIGLTIYPAASPNTTTSQNVVAATNPKRFFRVKAVRPLSP